ncbi:MAG: hypothetical protein ABSA69_02875 [Verrucomicrobiota bacterium]|jgi:hypothetical protein
MVFAHYRQLVTETQATEWFGIVPPKEWKNVLPVPIGTTEAQGTKQDASATTTTAALGYVTRMLR